MDNEKLIKGLTKKEYHSKYRSENREVIAYQQREFQRKLQESDPNYYVKKRKYAREYYKKNQEKLREYYRNYNKLKNNKLKKGE